MPPYTHVAEVEQVYRKHGSALLLFATALSGERSRAQDAVHQVFLKLVEGGSLLQTVDVKACLFACVRNAVLNDLKARQRIGALDHECAWFDPPDKDYAAERVADKLSQIRAMLQESLSGSTSWSAVPTAKGSSAPWKFRFKTEQRS